MSTPQREQQHQHQAERAAEHHGQRRAELAEKLLSGATAATAAIATVTALPAAASGFAIAERDAAGLGRAFAGQAAISSAASLSVNPAALPDAPTLSATLTGIRNQLEATDASGASADAGTTHLIPAAVGSWQGFGLGLDAPFGLSTDYPADWSGRTAALHSAITSARLTLGAGREVMPGLRLGASVFVQHLSAELSNALILAPGLEERVKVSGDDLGVGIGLGALWQPRDDLSLGLGVTSRVWHALTGQADLPARLGGDSDARVKLTTPESIRLGLAWHPRDPWHLFAGVEWTRWSRLQTLAIALDNGLTLREDHHWRDTWRLSLGTEHRRDPWTLRAGLAWDQSPVPSAANRYPRQPDTDRTWLALGLGYQRGPWQLDAGLAFLLAGKRSGQHPPLSYGSDTKILALGLTRTW